ncbi:MAG TPA: (E)-4-hydroxy-3-methylbut-2-enyl-diphosphate synthase [Cyclobacteriaceae bacterium]|nr:(E)-4-hydroxy-3-methylbut-2-enyl-diphosphate synthase [Cyclobacteriaceae bacterium]HMX02615.1 (E)-4-hydroxy-3-methylbut-2-enyl-diphosphate synthase [Cyclobacteriaceae bacterium]HMX50886.1 (E)-4-hydroxy-3-methylbut-2-enyl-diphosphate synthase [Cyclobacteriaceae bacterium]HMY92162.1 (E)-4-hydroxy-3-methylbut-2-enyl-diphosphate synthase [Cyclobacteriaceae bacterium]HNA13812.1 (E)-4-hydroxy-3-methylbut-2-enyl-diphosphate synthase [Cyclobacteriaceae bacterium]
MNLITTTRQYCNSLTEYSRRKTIEVKIGDVPLGGNNPIRIQSMTTVDTMDTKGSVEQVLRMVASGCEYVRITAPSLKEAQNLEVIKKELRARGCNVPLIADIHFTPNAAELAARIVEKVRINPGNYADKKRFETIEYTDDAYDAELERIRQKFTPLVKICKEYGTAMRIGTNHGSLSDRIMSRYGDTPLGMVESALEFLRICQDLDYHSIVLSMKASNPQVMVQAYRLLVHKLDEERFRPYPLHLGVTEAGDGEDGRIKSSVGIGTLLEDGLGDTVRVSLTEEPEVEAPVAKIMVDRYESRKSHKVIKPIEASPINPFAYTRRAVREVANLGGAHHVPRVIADLSKIEITDYKDLRSIGHFYLPEPDKWRMNDQGADYVYTGNKPIPFMLPNGLKEIRDYQTWQLTDDVNKLPLFRKAQYLTESSKHPEINFVKFSIDEVDDSFLQRLQRDLTSVAVIETDNAHAMPEFRRIFFELVEKGIDMPVLIFRQYPVTDEDTLRIHAATDIGGLYIDGFGDGIILGMKNELPKEDALRWSDICNKTAFGILQATRNRMSKTEYISCPSCGRTLFDLQETTAMIRKRTDHLKGVKIGIMGCIVNGPGEMADADYGYVGSGPGRITLYRNKDVVKKNVPSKQAVDELIGLIKEDGNWIDPELIEKF